MAFGAASATLLWLGCVTAASAIDFAYKAPGPAALSFEDFETYPDQAALERQWRRPHGDPSTIALTPRPRHAGRYSLKWTYDLTRYVTRASFIDRDPRNYDGIRFWLKPDGSGRNLNLGMKNHGQHAFQTVGLARLDGVAPVEIIVPFRQLGAGAKDALLEELWLTIDGSPGQGTIYLDDFAFVKIDPLLVEDFEDYRDDLDLYQHWKPIGQAATVGDVTIARIPTAANSANRAMCLVPKKATGGVRSFVEVDPRTYSGIAFQVMGAAGVDLHLSVKNHGQSIWRSPRVAVTADQQTVTIPFAAFRPAAGSPYRARSATVVDDYLEEVAIAVGGTTSSRICFDDVRLIR